MCTTIHCSVLCSLHCYSNAVCYNRTVRLSIFTKLRMMYWLCFAGVLDGREVKDAERMFLQNWRAVKEGRIRAAPSDGLGDGSEREIPTARNILQMLQLSRPPPTMPPLPQRAPLKGHRSKAVSRSVSSIRSSQSEATMNRYGERAWLGGARESARLPPLMEEPSIGEGVAKRWVLCTHM